jgi:hypothetical protein
MLMPIADSSDSAWTMCGVEKVYDRPTHRLTVIDGLFGLSPVTGEVLMDEFDRPAAGEQTLIATAIGHIREVELMTHVQLVALLTMGALLLIASPAAAAWVCTARNDAGQRWTITRANRAAAATTARQLCVARGASGKHCVIGCQGGGWGA